MLFNTIKLEKELTETKIENRKAKQSLADLRDENEECYRRIFKANNLVIQIKDLVEQNEYDNPTAKIRKIKELIRDFEDAN